MIRHPRIMVPAITAKWHTLLKYYKTLFLSVFNCEWKDVSEIWILETVSVTHWGRGKWPSFCKHFQMHFHEWTLLNFISFHVAYAGAYGLSGNKFGVAEIRSLEMHSCAAVCTEFCNNRFHKVWIVMENILAKWMLNGYWFIAALHPVNSLRPGDACIRR